MADFTLSSNRSLSTVDSSYGSIEYVTAYGALASGDSLYLTISSNPQPPFYEELDIPIAEFNDYSVHATVNGVPISVNWVTDGYFYQFVSTTNQAVNFQITVTSNAFSESGSGILFMLTKGYWTSQQVNELADFSGVSIAGVARPPEVTITDTTSSLSLTEGAGAKYIHLTLSQAVNYSINVSAQLPGSDADVSLAKSFVIPAGSTSYDVPISALSDKVLESIESGTVQFVASADGHAVGFASGASSTTIQVRDEALGPPESPNLEAGKEWMQKVIQATSVATQLAAPYVDLDPHSAAAHFISELDTIEPIAGIVIDESANEYGLFNHLQYAENISKNDPVAGAAIAYAAYERAEVNFLEGIIKTGFEGAVTSVGTAYAIGEYMYVVGALAPASVPILAAVAIGFAAKLTYDEFFAGSVEDSLREEFESTHSKATFEQQWLQSHPIQANQPDLGPMTLNNFSWQQGWGNQDNPRTIADIDHNGSSDYLAFGSSDTLVANGVLSTAADGSLAAAFANVTAVVHDFGTSEGYTAEVQRGAAWTGTGTGDAIYGQGYTGIYWYGATGAAAHTDGAGGAYSTVSYDSSPNWYGQFGSNEGWTQHNTFQILKVGVDDPIASIVGFGSDGIIVGPQAFQTGASASQSYLIPIAIGNNAGWDQLTDVRTFQDDKGGIVDLNHDGIADFLGMGPQGLVFAFGTEDASQHYGLGALQTANLGSGPNLGRAQGWTDDGTQRVVVHDQVTGLDDVFAFGSAGVYVTMGQDPATHGGQPFGQLYLGMADMGSNQGWSNQLTPRLIGDVNGDGTPDIVGFGADNTFVAVGSRDASGNIHFAFDQTKTIHDFGYNEGWSITNTVRELADVSGSGHDSLVLSGAFGTHVYDLL